MLPHPYKFLKIGNHQFLPRKKRDPETTLKFMDEKPSATQNFSQNLFMRIGTKSAVVTAFYVYTSDKETVKYVKNKTPELIYDVPKINKQ